MKETTCRFCGYKLDSNTSVTDEKATPREGDFSACISCGVISKFDYELNLLPADKDDLVRLSDDDPEAFYLLMKASRLIREQKL